MSNVSGYFMELQNFSVNDGNGIRTVIFFAGCPLKCQWCSNPEGYTSSNKVAYYKKICMKCERCIQVCPYKVGMDLNSPLERIRCKSCGICVKLCPTNSRKNLIYYYNTEQILKMIEKQEIFYRYSGGGVTFSGGEAALQADILRDLVCKLYDKAIDLAIETSGYFNFDDMKDILEKLNLIFIDIKHMDDKKHRFYTGLRNTKILNNILRLNELKVAVVVRIPVIDGVNSDVENIRRTAKFVKSNIDMPKLELLPFHSFGDSKYEALSLEKPSRHFKTPSQEHLRKLYEIVESEGVEVVSYR
ncbi:glycyl-radical enzyme activating protein family [Alkaliphilus metalliredigens QYMF]|uniref:Glycyl-radical enzyme activating protein family n=1 Tax=Alkaliphilus metalliredigens (strain QYMF) TaxID=293826 RepID=A6TPN2_ALKMQ|nr:glycyl-radical enzyme activating protein [Alkaliphilus metalliredigens]ABR48150.1 glycyl-radical enzyme activating protein family [Alkaliphilus metalliredigens QYMF]